MLGGTGDDTVTYADRTAPVTVSLNSLDGDGEAGESDNVYDDVENLEGGSGADTLIGQAALPVSNNFDGNGGGDTLDGGAGDDSADGGAGDDIVIGDLGSDQYLGGSGIDVLDYSNRSGEFTEDLDVTLAASIFLDDGGTVRRPRSGSATTPSGIENLTGGDGNDKLTGAPGKNVIKGGAGDDEVRVDDGEQDVADCGAGQRRGRVRPGVDRRRAARSSSLSRRSRKRRSGSVGPSSSARSYSARASPRAAEPPQQLGAGRVQVAVAVERQRVHERQRALDVARLGDRDRAVELDDRRARHAASDV